MLVGLRESCVAPFAGVPTKSRIHHVGGRNHVVWFTIPLCRKHHVKLTAYIAAAGVDMRYSPDRPTRFRRARQAICMLLWFLDMQEEEFTSQDSEKRSFKA